MATTKTFLVLSFMCFLVVPTGALTCKSSTCPLTIRHSSYSSNPTIQFPFRLNKTHPRCGYPGFDLSCNNKNQTILSTTTSGNLSVAFIDYWSQTLQVNDPDNCMPGRYLVDFTVDPPFKLDSRTEYQSFTFLNCSSVNQTERRYFAGFPCLSGDNYTVGVMLSYEYRPPSTCREIKTVSLPLRNGWDVRESFFEDVSLSSIEPYCGESCLRQGGSCGFKSRSGLEVACSNIRGETKKETETHH